MRSPRLTRTEARAFPGYQDECATCAYPFDDGEKVYLDPDGERVYCSRACARRSFELDQLARKTAAHMLAGEGV